MYAETKTPIRRLGKRYGVSKSLVWRIIKGEVYKPEKYEVMEEDHDE